MFFSIIIPTYNQSNWIEESINGILNQTFINFELIVSDDSEDDLTKNIVLKISDSRIIYKKNSPRLGRVGNYRKSVLEYAKGDWCLICDGDDYISDVNYLQYCFNIIIKNPSIVMVQAGHFVGDDISHAITSMPNIENSSKLIKDLDYFLHFDKYDHFSHLSTVSNLKFLKEINPFRLNILSTDIETYLRLSFHGDVVLLKKAVGLWRQHDNNASNSVSFDEHLKNIQSILSSGKYLFDRTGLDFVLKTFRGRVLNNLIYLIKTDNIKFDSSKYFNFYQITIFLFRYNLFWLAVSNKSFLFHLFKFLQSKNTN